MATILKCKMCGGDIEVDSSMTIGTCLYCGSTMTLPHIDSDKKARLFNRANEYRLNNEFDKAYEAYQTIVDEDEQEAEAYWGMVLSEYGIEYVEDPSSKRRIPTCHRTHIQSIKGSTNYVMACKYADAESRFMYNDEAEIIDDLSKRIISISSKEEPYDVFICYKESEENGDRTIDSVIAQEVYNELEKNGIRTFFARISLEDKLGKDYEPYIYSALTSSRVMLMISSSREHCNAVWVKNEWSRFLQFMEQNEDKVLIPVYKDMSPYELPDAFSKYQAQDIGKVGAVQDLVYGVQKILGKAPKSTGKTLSEAEVLSIVNRNAEQKRKKTLKAVKIAFAIIGACVLLVCGVTILNKYYIQPLKKYNVAVRIMQTGEYDTAKQQFLELGDFKDSDVQALQCDYLVAERLLEDTLFDDAKAAFQALGEYSDSSTKALECDYKKAKSLADKKKYADAKTIFESLNGYSDSSNWIKECDYRRAFEIVGSENLCDVKEDRRNNYFNLLLSLGEYKGAADRAVSDKYQCGVEWINRGDLNSAMLILSEITEYADATELYNECLWQMISDASNNADYESAISHYDELIARGDEGAEESLVELYAAIYGLAEDAYKSKDYDTALKYYNILANHEYEDSAAKSEETVATIKKVEEEAAAEVARIAAEKQKAAEEAAAEKKAEQDRINALKSAIVGTWYSSNSWPWGCTIKVSSGYSMTYALGDDSYNSTSLSYNSSNNTFSFKWVSYSYTAKVNGSTMTVTSSDSNAPYFVGTFSKIE